MFDNLIESKAKKQKRAGGTVMSAFIHAAVISAAVYATAHATDALDKPKAEKVEFVTVKKDEPPPPKETPKPPPPDVVMKAPPPKGFQVCPALGDNWRRTCGIAGNHGDPKNEIQNKLDDDQETPDHHNVSDA